MPDVRSDFAQAALVTPAEMTWVPSPQPQVDRVMLDRLGDEAAVATSLVRYAPDSTFPAHNHPLGEELLVLEGEFADEHGRYGAGSYLRNPPGSGHAPFSEPGCIIFVKLRQFHVNDTRQAVLDTNLPVPDEGVARRHLHAHDDESVAVLAAAAGATVTLEPADQLQEVLVLEGELAQDGQRLPRWSWLRLPAGEGAELVAHTAARLLHKHRPECSLESRNG